MSYVVGVIIDLGHHNVDDGKPVLMRPSNIVNRAVRLAKLDVSIKILPNLPRPCCEPKHQWYLDQEAL